MNKLLLFLLFVFPLTLRASELPDWIKNPTCGDNLCAVGHGNTLDLATADARNNIQKIFETKISSKFKNEVTQIIDQSSELIQEETEGILKGTTIEKVFEKGSDYYVLAVLDKTKVANDLEFEIEMLDRKMSVLLDDNTIASSKKLEEMYKKRENLNRKYLFLTGKEIKEEVEYKNVFKNNKNNFSKAGSYYVNIENEELRSFLTNLLIENGINIVNNSSSAKKVLSGKIINKKEFLNVDGFEKYSFNLNLQLVSNGKILKTINKKFTETGLSFEQIHSKVLAQIQDYLEKNIINILE